MAKSIEDAIRDAGVSDEDAAASKHFVGYLGASDSDARIRLYLNEQQSEYIEAPADATTVVDLGGANSPLVLLVVKQFAQLNHFVRLSDRSLLTEQVGSNLLAGEIANQYLQQIGRRGFPPLPPEPFSVGGRCWPIVFQVR